MTADTLAAIVLGVTHDEEIEMLPSTYQRLLRWVDLGWSHDRIAGELGLVPQAVGPLVTLAAAKLQHAAAPTLMTNEEKPMNDADQLTEINQMTFLAESRPARGVAGRPWDEYLADAFRDDFVARRGKPDLPHQDRTSFIAFAHDASAATREIVGTPMVWVDGNLGGVACDVRLGDDDSVWFRNLKLFAKTSRWQCVYWQVTPFDPLRAGPEGGP